MRHIRSISIGAVAVVIGLLLYFHLSDYKRQLSFVPFGMEISNVLYAEEESWGFGPGGNETGVIVYELPVPISQEIVKRGVLYFENLPQRSDEGWHGVYKEWQNTPITSGPDWRGPDESADLATSPPRISNYLSKYGFAIFLESEVEKMIDTAISQPGSFFAYGRIGVFIVIPEANRAIYAYNG